MTEPERPDVPLTAEQALAAADLRAYWRDLDREAEQAVPVRAPRPRAWPVHRIVPTPSVPLRLGGLTPEPAPNACAGVATGKENGPA